MWKKGGSKFDAKHNTDEVDEMSEYNGPMSAWRQSFLIDFSNYAIQFRFMFGVRFTKVYNDD